MTLGNLEPRCGENCCYAKGIAEVGNSECRVEMYEKYAGSQDAGYSTQMAILELSGLM